MKYHIDKDIYFKKKMYLCIVISKIVMNRITLFHVYANLLAVGKIREMVEYGNMSYVLEKYDKYRNYIDKDITSVGDLLSYAYSEMKKNYRNEYVYKNTIITDLIKKHRFTTSVIFNEFRVGRSIADLVFLNGTDRVFEIKTEFDNDTRLKSQIGDYQKAFSRVFVVVPELYQDKYFEELSPTIGIIVMTKRGAIKTIRDAIEDKSHLDSEVMMKCLRKQEFTEIIRRFYPIPDVPSIRYFKDCLSLFNQIPMDNLHPLFIKVLKMRKQGRMSYLRNDVPNYLKYLLINLDFDEFHYNKLNSYLETNIYNYELFSISKR